MSHIGNFNVNFNNAFYVAQQFRNVQAILKIMLIEKMIFAFSDNAQVRLMIEPPLRSLGWLWACAAVHGQFRRCRNNTWKTKCQRNNNTLKMLLF